MFLCIQRIPVYIFCGLNWLVHVIFMGVKDVKSVWKWLALRGRAGLRKEGIASWMTSCCLCRWMASLFRVTQTTRLWRCCATPARWCTSGWHASDTDPSMRNCSSTWVSIQPWSLKLSLPWQPVKAVGISIHLDLACIMASVIYACVCKCLGAVS